MNSELFSQHCDLSIRTRPHTSTTALTTSRRVPTICREAHSKIRYAAGWRIDYQIATPGLAKQAVTAVTERAATHDERWSDHAPVTVTFDV